LLARTFKPRSQTSPVWERVPHTPSFPNSSLGTHESKLRFEYSPYIVAQGDANGSLSWLLCGRQAVATWPRTRDPGQEQKNRDGVPAVNPDAKRSFDSCVPKREFGNEEVWERGVIGNARIGLLFSRLRFH